MAALLMLPTQELKQTPFIDKDGNAAFYRRVAEARNLAWDDIESIDPRKIYVPRALYEQWLDAMKTRAEHESLAMLLADRGPKVMDDLEYGMVQMDDDAFRTKE